MHTNHFFNSSSCTACITNSSQRNMLFLTRQLSLESIEEKLYKFVLFHYDVFLPFKGIGTRNISMDYSVNQGQKYGQSAEQKKGFSKRSKL